MSLCDCLEIAPNRFTCIFCGVSFGKYKYFLESSSNSFLYFLFQNFFLRIFFLFSGSLFTTDTVKNRNFRVKYRTDSKVYRRGCVTSMLRILTRNPINYTYTREINTGGLVANLIRWTSQWTSDTR